ncbi:MAG: hypothetical protein K9L57_01890 [Spirochaetaceae bacterium]|nr:hypothetical protein [Spirochaetaceae bacterium]
MKKGIIVVLIAAALILTITAVAAADDLSMDATANDSVGVSYSESGTVTLLGIVGNDAVSLSLNGGTYGASEPGAQATLGGGSSEVTGTGGYLHYTLYGVGNHKITVETSTVGYGEDTLSVQISDGTVDSDNTSEIVAGGSAAGTLGTAATGFVAIGTTAADLITGITGTASSEGAPVEYELSGDPGVDTVDVLYTITSET